MSKPKITPLGDRVLVKHVEEDEQIKGGIIIPDSAKEKSQEAQVVALGTGKKDDDGKNIGFQVKKGDKVLISKYGGTEVKLDAEIGWHGWKSTSLFEVSGALVTVHEKPSEIASLQVVPTTASGLQG
jgi:chaperonin GroES